MGNRQRASPSEMTVIFSVEAVADLEHIRAYIGERSPAAASRVAVQLVAACDRLEYMSERGRLSSVESVRELSTVWPYVIAYRITETAVEIVRVWHGAQHR